MKKYVNWNFITSSGNDVATDFIRLANLDNEEAKIILDRKNRRKTQYATAMEIGCSPRHITNKVNELIEKYKETQKIYPDILPALNNSAEMKKFKKNCEYKNISAIVNIESKDNIYSIKIVDEFFPTFMEIRLYIIDKLQEKYNILIDDLVKYGYQTYVSGNYFRKK